MPRYASSRSDTPHPAACHIGPNVTFGEQIRKVEAHLLDFHGDLYGRIVELDILRAPPAHPTFAGLDDLLCQISPTSIGPARYSRGLDPSRKIDRMAIRGGRRGRG